MEVAAKKKKKKMEKKKKKKNSKMSYPLHALLQATWLMTAACKMSTSTGKGTQSRRLLDAIAGSATVSTGDSGHES